MKYRIEFWNGYADFEAENDKEALEIANRDYSEQMSKNGTLYTTIEDDEGTTIINQEIN